MTLKNNSQQFGSLTKLLHWSIFALFLLQFTLVYRREFLPEDSPESMQYIGWHVSFGVCIFLVALFMIVWRHVGQRPAMQGMSAFEIFAAKFVHFLLYATMLWMPISGMLMSMLGGYDVSVFNWFTLPNPFTKNEGLGHFFYNTHVWCSYLIIGLVSIHVLAALYHQFVKHDNVLRRMMPS